MGAPKQKIELKMKMESYGLKPEIKEMTCIICPMGCRMRVVMENGKLADIEGNGCKRGASYAREECVNPVRTITSTMRLKNGKSPLVPVKTDRPVPKALMMDCMKTINGVRAMAPVRSGDILVENILNTGANVIATADAN